MDIENLTDMELSADTRAMISFVDSLVLQRGRTAMVVLSPHTFTLLINDPPRLSEDIQDIVLSRLADCLEEDPEYSLDIFDEDRSGYLVTLTNAGIYAWNDDISEEEYASGNLEIGKVYMLRKEIAQACEDPKILAIVRI